MNSKKRERFEITQGYADRYIRDVQTDEIHNLHSACGLLNKFNDSITYYQNMLDQRDWQAVNNQNWILQKHLKEAEIEAEEYNLDAMNYQTLYEQQLGINKELKQSNKDAWNLIRCIYNEIKEDGYMDWGRIQDLVEF